MKLGSNGVFFRYSTYEELFLCDWVEFGVEFVGEVVEDIDYDLIEDYEDVRLLVWLKMTMETFDEADWLAGFLGATDKHLVIDGREYEVVNDAKNVRYKLWDKSNAGTVVNLQFKARSLGLITYLMSRDDELIKSRDGKKIKLRG